MVGMIISLPISFEVLDAATERCLPGFARGFINFKKDSEHSVPGSMTVRKLWQGDIGDMGTVSIEKLRIEESQIHFSGPPSASDDEAMDYAELLLPDMADKTKYFVRSMGKQPPAWIRAMIAFDIVRAESITFIPPSEERPSGSWQLGKGAPPITEVALAANEKLAEWRKTLGQKRDEHYRNVITAFFNRLYGEDIWPKQLLFSGKSESPDKTLDTLKALVLKHLPPGDSNQPFFSGSVEEISILPRKFMILADSHGSGRLVIGWIEFSSFPDSEKKFSATCYGNNVPNLLSATRDLFGELANSLAEQPTASIKSNEQANNAKPGRRSYPDDIWARQQVANGRLKMEVFKEWVILPEVKERNLQNPKDSFNKLMQKQNKKRKMGKNE